MNYNLNSNTDSNSELGLDPSLKNITPLQLLGMIQCKHQVMTMSEDPLWYRCENCKSWIKK